MSSMAASIIKVIIIFAVYVGISSLLTIGIFSILRNIVLVTDPFVQIELTTFFQFLITAIIVLIINRANWWNKPQSRFSLNGVSLILILVVSLCTRISVQGMLWIDEILTNTPIEIKHRNFDFLGRLHIIIAVHSIVLAPLIEEIIFRKWILGLFQNRGKQIFFGLIISSVLFCLIHENQPAIDSFFTGLIMGLIYLRFGLLASILFHSFYNLFWFIVRTNRNFYEKVINWFDFGFSYWAIIFAAIIMISIFIFQSIKFIKLKYISEPGNFVS